MYTGVVILFVTIPLHITSSADAKDNGRIHYPGPIKETSVHNKYGNNDAEDIPEQCKGKTYCTVKPKDYPQEKFNKLFKNVVRPIQQASLVLSDIDDRQGDPEEVDNCETIVTFDNIYKVKSKTGEWRDVVQAPEKNFVQKVRLETCQAENEECFNYYLGLPGYTTFCKQQYTKWEFVVEATDGSDNTEKISYEPLYRVRTQPGDWRTVVQAPDMNYVQQVRLETCKGIREPCFTIFPKQPTYTTACKQKFSTWEFVVESNKGSGQFDTVKVDLPTCCSCHYKPT